MNLSQGGDLRGGRVYADFVAADARAGHERIGVTLRAYSSWMQSRCKSTSGLFRSNQHGTRLRPVSVCCPTQRFGAPGLLRLRVYVPGLWLDTERSATFCRDIWRK